MMRPYAVATACFFVALLSAVPLFSQTAEMEAPRLNACLTSLEIVSRAGTPEVDLALRKVFKGFFGRPEPRMNFDSWVAFIDDRLSSYESGHFVMSHLKSLKESYGDVFANALPRILSELAINPGIGAQQSFWTTHQNTLRQLQIEYDDAGNVAKRIRDSGQNTPEDPDISRIARSKAFDETEGFENVGVHPLRSEDHRVAGKLSTRASHPQENRTKYRNLKAVKRTDKSSER